MRIETFDLDLEGPIAEEPRIREARAGLDVGPEEPFSHGAYENAKSELLEAAGELGYFDAEFTRHRVVVDPEANLADIELTLSGGVRYSIGEIRIQQRALKDELFRRFVEFEVGDPYDARDLTRTYQSLLQSDYFNRVLVTPELDERGDGRVPVQVTATATTRRSTLVGAGYATDTGPRARLALSAGERARPSRQLQVAGR